MPTSGFLDLPGEIRNQIYRLLLVLPVPPQTPHALHVKIHPQIISACRQTHHEGSTILYTQNTFVAHDALLTDMPRLRRWYPAINSPRYIALITRIHLHIRLDTDVRFTAEKASMELGGLDELTVEVFQAQHGSCGFGNLRLLEDVCHVGKCSVMGSIHAFRGYARWLEGSMTSQSHDLVEPFSESDEDMEVRKRGYGAHNPWTLST